MIPKCRLRWKMCQRAQIWVRFFHIHALQASTFCCRYLHAACALDQNFARLALRILECQEWSICFGRGKRPLHRDDELMTSLAAIVDFYSQDVCLIFG